MIQILNKRIGQPPVRSYLLVTCRSFEFKKKKNISMGKTYSIRKVRVGGVKWNSEKKKNECWSLFHIPPPPWDILNLFSICSSFIHWIYRPVPAVLWTREHLDIWTVIMSRLAMVRHRLLPRDWQKMLNMMEKWLELVKWSLCTNVKDNWGMALKALNCDMSVDM